MNKSQITKFEYYAGQALAGLAANPTFSFATSARKFEIEQIANIAWNLAQEMMTYDPTEQE